MAKKTAEVTDEIETLDEEVEETEAPAKTKKVRKAKVEKPVLEGMTSKEAAAAIGITPVKLRRILRSDDFYPDKNYTRYALTDEVIDRVKAAIAAGSTSTTEKKPRTKKAKAAVVETASEDIAEELDSLDDLASDEDAEEVDVDEDEEEDE